MSWKKRVGRGFQNPKHIHWENLHSKSEVHYICGIQAMLKNEVTLPIFMDNKEKHTSFAYGLYLSNLKSLVFLVYVNAPSVRVDGETKTFGMPSSAQTHILA